MLCIDFNCRLLQACEHVLCVLTDVCVSRVIVANLSSASIVAIALLRAVASCLPSWGLRWGWNWSVRICELWSRKHVDSTCQAPTRAPWVSRVVNRPRRESQAVAGIRRGQRRTGAAEDVRRLYVLQKCADST